jgi:CRP-like cAMP-binding protein
MTIVRPFMQKLEQLGPFGDQERRLLESLSFNGTITFDAGQDLAREGERPSDCKLIVEGYACRYKALKYGERQIVSFHLPGDIIDLNSLLLGRIDHSIGALTLVKCIAIPHATLRDWIERHPRLTQMLWRDTLVDAAVFREWVVNVGRRSAYQRIAHLVCELVTRLRAAGLVQAGACDLPPITESDIADATGLSVVHVNRALQQLRGDRLLDLRAGVLVALDWERMRQAAGYDPAYLHPLAEAA